MTPNGDGDRRWLADARAQATRELQDFWGRCEHLSAELSRVNAELSRAMEALERTTTELEALRASRVWRTSEAIRRLRLRHAAPEPTLATEAQPLEPRHTDNNAQSVNPVCTPLDPVDVPPGVSICSSPGVVLLAEVADAARDLLERDGLDALLMAGIDPRRNDIVIPRVPPPGRDEADEGATHFLLIARDAFLDDPDGVLPAMSALARAGKQPGARIAIGDGIGFALTATPDPQTPRPTGSTPGHRRRPPRSTTIIIPTRDRLELLRRAIDAAEDASHRSIEIVIVDNESTDPETVEFLSHLTHRVVPAPGPFNFPDLIAAGAAHANTESLILLNNDVVATDSRWVDALLDCLSTPSSAVAGALLLYPDETMQHCGIVIHDGEPVHALAGLPQEAAPLGLLDGERQCTAVTGACMAIDVRVWEQLGGFERLFVQNYNDIDFCLRASVMGGCTVFTPHARLIHDESASRGQEWNADVAGDHVLFRARWALELDKGDPFWPGDVDVQSGRYCPKGVGAN